MSLLKLYKCMKLLNVQHPDIASREIDTFCRNNIDMHNFFKNDPVQVGGGSIIMKIKGTKFNFYKVDFGNSVTYNLHKDNNEQESECIIIMVDKENKVANIHNLSYDDKCFTENNVKHIVKSGSSLLAIAIYFVHKIKKHYKITKVEVTDNATKICNENHKPIRIWIMSTLKYGDTWYGKFGFIPKYGDEKNDYIENKKLMKNLLVKDTNIMNIIEEYSKKLGYDDMYKNIKKMNDDFKNEKVTTFISSFLNKFDETCELFSEICNKIVKDIGLNNMFRISYVMEF